MQHTLQLLVPFWEDKGKKNENIECQTTFSLAVLSSLSSSSYDDCRLNFTVEWLALLLRIRDVPEASYYE